MSYPEHRQRSRLGNTHVDCRTGVRSPNRQQFSTQHRIMLDVHGYCRPGTTPETGIMGRRSTPESSANSAVNKLRMIYNLRASTPNLPYDPYTLQPDKIARTNTQSQDQLRREIASRGGLWSPSSHGCNVPLARHPTHSWKVHTRIGAQGETPNTIPALRNMHSATPQPVLGEGLRD